MNFIFKMKLLKFTIFLVLFEVSSCVESIDWESSVHELTDDEIDLLVEDTHRLLKLDENIVLLEEYKDLVLVIGNTGTGKSTLTKFLTTDGSTLVAYFSPDGFRIRDEEGEISNSTLISQSLLPQLMINNATNTAFYDMPGFSDSRNASVEIANAFFMKKVADHAERVKLLFVVDYYDITSGRDRDDFLKMIKQGVDFVKDATKFVDSISLVASKVEKSWNDTMVIAGIAYFLETALNDLEILIPNPETREMCTSLINSFMTPTEPADPLHPYSRIGLFRVPDEEGPLNQIPTVMNSRPWVEQIIYQNTEYQEKELEDFGLSLSPEAVIVVHEAVARAQKNMTILMDELRGVAETEYENAFREGEDLVFLNHSYYLVDKLYGDYVIIKDLVDNLNSQDNLTVSEFLEMVHTAFVLGPPFLSIKDSVERVLEELISCREQLKFFDTILDSGLDFPLPLDWLLSLGSIRRDLATKLVNFVSTKILPELDHMVQKYASDLKSLLTTKFHDNFHKTSALQADLEHDYQILTTFTTDLLSSSTLKEFSEKNWTVFNELSVSFIEDPPVSPNSLLEVDLPILFPISWTKVFDTSLAHLKLRREFLLNINKVEIQSPLKTNWGGWGAYEDCGKGSVVSGIQLRVAPPSRSLYDQSRTKTWMGRPGNRELHGKNKTLGNHKNQSPYQNCYRSPSGPPYIPDTTALNSIYFFCSPMGQPKDVRTKTLVSKEGNQGSPRGEFHCEGLKKAIGFELRSEGPRPDRAWQQHYDCCWAWWDWMCDFAGTWESGWSTNYTPEDDTAANNLRLICEDGKVVEADGNDRGEWTGQQVCPDGQFLCGLQTQVDEAGNGGAGDVTALNNLKAHCCTLYN